MEEMDVVSVKNPRSLAAEAFRTLRTNVQFSSLDKELKKISVTSLTKGDGKSTIVSNLACIMAQSGEKVLLVDCDLRKPRVHKKFNLDNQKGLTNLATNQSIKEDVIKTTDIEHLDIITSGPIPPNPSEILGSVRMKQLLNELAEDYDRILIDSPPVSVVTDPVIISQIVDGVLLVVPAGQLNKEHGRRGIAALRTVNANILGAVLNKVPVEDGTYYYQYYYGQEYNDDKTKTKIKKKKKRGID